MQEKEVGINTNGYTINDWLKGLKVELENGTSVINIAYKDTDKNLILPVMNRVSKTYQSYSGRDQARGLTQAVNYLEKQLNILKTQANDHEAAQTYALSNGLDFKTECQPR